MLTRLRVKGFKNLKDVDLSFGPFTCIAGRNGVGKSNVFDAIAFLSDLASMPLIKAATRVRGAEDRIAGIESLFARGPDGDDRRIEFRVDMIVPGEVTDDFERPAVPRATYLQYALSLRYDPISAGADKDPIYIEREDLVAKPSSEAAASLTFRPGKAWVKRYVSGPGSRHAPFIDTAAAHDPAISAIQLHGEGKGGRPSAVPARHSPQTVLSGVNTSSYPTALAARREMQSWRLLQLEPSALRLADEFRGESQISATGRHLPNALLRTGQGALVTERLSELIPGILAVDVDSDKTRQSRTLKVTMKDRQPYAASSLSDGTLRFLALAVLASDPLVGGLTCLEEPENGIHPLRIPQMLTLVRDLADIESWVDEGPEPKDSPAPIRQVIINTHSPIVVADLPDTDLLMAETVRERGREWVNFRPLPGTWRAAGLGATQLIARGELEAYLGAPARARHSASGAAPMSVAQRLVDWNQPDLFTTP